MIIIKEDDSPPHLKKGLLLLVALIITLSFVQPVTAKTGAYNVYDDGNVVGGTFRCSCGVGTYEYRTAYFKDTCPMCGGNLAFEQGAYHGYNKGSSPEGMWYCTVCDSDRI